jgi:hypothetical protein
MTFNFSDEDRLVDMGRGETERDLERHNDRGPTVSDKQLAYEPFLGNGASGDGGSR